MIDKNKELEIQERFDSCLDELKKVVDLCFDEFNSNPDSKDDMVKIWKKYIIQFMDYSMKQSEKKNGSEIYKGIIRSMMFR